MGFLDGGVQVFEIRNLNLKDGGYDAGDVITGEVVLVATKEIKCRAFLITLSGNAATRWERKHYNNDGCSDTEYYKGHEKITEDCKVFHGEGVIAPGNFVHKFTLKLPKSCPPSFAGVHGCITYTLIAKIDRPMAIDNEVQLAVMVKGFVDLQAMGPSVAQPVENQGVAKIGMCCCTDGRIRIHASLSKGGFAIGEHVEIIVEVGNYTSRPVVALIANILENATFTAFHGGIWGGGGQAEKCNGTKPVVSATKPVNIPSQAEEKVCFAFLIPKIIAPHVDCSIIHTEHAIEICAQHESGEKGYTCVLPITLGTVSLPSKGGKEALQL
ncbi:hypothetical protein QR680_014801 [Steinernema hermaphroditum]|uniref:Arrestin C-terminal-like domain-containing protein n=1 Tax=Steinernema hermaphroditum TaxID=289476 RepID=A0AA39ICP4_9BILA|nr:hypothetical protein QR680_014801 [Steinernema hermaphroditum]